MKFKQIFWDSDGTLVNTEPAYFSATQKVLKEEGVELTEDWYSANTIKNNVSPFTLLAQKELSLEKIQQLRNKRNQLYSELILDKVEIFPGVLETLTQLHGKIPMSIVTSSHREHFEIIMAATGLAKFFDFFITSDDVQNIKPNAEPYLKAWKMSGFPKEDCLVIEDTERGLIAAKAAGLPCYVIPNELSKSNDFSSADKVLSSPLELLSEESFLKQEQILDKNDKTMLNSSPN
jgi:HAD superfamily hydrolase (TIGR01509 family)